MKPYTGRIPFDELPTIALMCMSFNPVYTKYSICNAHHQIYPDDKKVMVLLQQRPFPDPIKHDLSPFKIVQINVEGKWPEVWMFKLIAFLDYCKSNGIEYAAFYDEDDLFPPYYLWSGMDSLLIDAKQIDAEISWTQKNIVIKRQSMTKEHYDNAIGNSFGTVKAYDEALQLLRKIYPQGIDFGKKRKKKDASHYAVDGNYFNILGSNFKTHTRNDETQLRKYFFHGLANTDLSSRKTEDNVDYGWDWQRSTGMLKSFQVVSYYTRDSIYENIAHRLMQSTAHFHIPLRVYSYPSKGNWFLNLHLKPECILKAMDEFPNKNILYTDGDSFFRKYPILLDDYEYDLACLWLNRWEMQPQKYNANAAEKRKVEKPILSAGTVWVKNKPEVRRYIERWLAMLKANPKLFEQDGLNQIYKQAQSEGVIKVAPSLPPEYCMVCLDGKPIDESIPYEDVVIQHGRSTKEMMEGVK